MGDIRRKARCPNLRQFIRSRTNLQSTLIMDTKIYKVIPWEEVAIGQDFEKSKQNWDLSSFANPWIKRSLVTYQDKAEESALRTYGQSIEFECIVRISDCKPELDFDTWWEGEGAITGYDGEVAVACRAAWNAAKGTPTPTTNEH